MVLFSANRSKGSSFSADQLSNASANGTWQQESSRGLIPSSFMPAYGQTPGKYQPVYRWRSWSRVPLVDGVDSDCSFCTILCLFVRNKGFVPHVDDAAAVVVRLCYVLLLLLQCCCTGTMLLIWTASRWKRWGSYLQLTVCWSISGPLNRCECGTGRRWCEEL